MPKRLAAFCDGTWARLQDREVETKGRSETNVALLYRVAASSPEAAQEAAYFSGVGADRWPIIGGVTGAGLDGKILEAYDWLCQRYAFGDQVYLFGFSRGAYTARSLVGLIRNVGFLRSPTKRLLSQAMNIYRGNDGPDSKRAQKFRKANAAAFVEPQNGGLALVEATTGATLPHAVTFLGVWDTVGALGVPARLPFAMLFNRRHRFHDLALTRSVEAAAHAIAADERRVTFAATPFDNLEALNAGLPAPRYQQAWFPGDHGGVGGGDPDRRLSDGALIWMAQAAAAAGLDIDAAHPELAQARATANPVEGVLRSRRPGWLGAFSRLADRDEMGPADVPHMSATARMAAIAAYRPAPLRRVWPV